MKTILVMAEVEDNEWEEICEELDELLLSAKADDSVRVTAYSTYFEGDMIPDIMNRKRCQ